MKTILAAIGLVVVLLVLALFAVCNDDDNDADSYGTVRIVLASHGYDDGGDYYGGYQGRDDEGGYNYRHGRRGGRDEYDQRYGNEGDQSRCRGRGCRGSFSPGPFDRSPVTICLPYSCNSGGEQSGGNRNEQPPPDQGGEA